MWFDGQTFDCRYLADGHLANTIFGQHSYVICSFFTVSMSTKCLLSKWFLTKTHGICAAGFARELFARVENCWNVFFSPNTNSDQVFHMPSISHHQNFSIRHLLLAFLCILHCYEIWETVAEISLYNLSYPAVLHRPCYSNLQAAPH
jgi:hypothetical protein